MSQTPTDQQASSVPVSLGTDWLEDLRQLVRDTVEYTGDTALWSLAKVALKNAVHLRDQIENEVRVERVQRDLAALEADVFGRLKQARQVIRPLMRCSDAEHASYAAYQQLREAQRHWKEQQSTLITDDTALGGDDPAVSETVALLQKYHSELDRVSSSLLLTADSIEKFEFLTRQVAIESMRSVFESATRRYQWRKRRRWALRVAPFVFLSALAALVAVGLLMITENQLGIESAILAFLFVEGGGYLLDRAILSRLLDPLRERERLNVLKLTIFDLAGVEILLACQSSVARHETAQVVDMWTARISSGKAFTGTAPKEEGRGRSVTGTAETSQEV
jgi:hypothetical protein